RWEELARAGARVRELAGEERAWRVALLHEVAISRIAATHLDRRRATEALHQLTQESDVAVHVRGKIRPVDDERLHSCVPAPRVQLADIGELLRAEAACHRILPRVQRVDRLALPARKAERRLVLADLERGARLGLGRHLGTDI